MAQSSQLQNLAAQVTESEDFSDSESSGCSSVFESSLPFLFGHSPFACGSSRTHPFTYQPPLTPDSAGRHLEPICLQVSEPPAQLHRLQAHYVWVSSIYMADLIHAGEIDCRNKRILELGAGAGLASVAAALYGSCETIVSSDWPNGQILETLEKNLRSNVPHSSVWKVIGHRWGHATDELLFKPSGGGGPDQLARFDLILLADVLWIRDSHEDLLNTVIDTLSRKSDAMVYLTAGLHDGQRGPIEGFANRAQGMGFRIQWIREVRCGPEEPRKWTSYQRSDHKLSTIDESGVIVFFSMQLPA
ncbi:hypothetical protein CROQUDRAFT_669572 [Cronartium quercuum f. sp. fusiforme G11]|uniref:Uncharacterized protein n=1 Tax=Cronartium quercuum f. sp. fusiforme G11 TaxID=708437 RepID=A0A9P6NMS0_9BASI|nr:hypothetical protein CROQUDRAFT_669572 [Cronartium quercuum f. sp. fusiforme G11]